MVDAAKIIEALNGLDPDEDSAWTSTNLPRVEAVLASLQAEDPLFDEELKRADIEAAFPDFNRLTVITADEDDNATDESATDTEDTPSEDDEADTADETDEADEPEADEPEADEPEADEPEIEPNEAPEVSEAETDIAAALELPAVEEVLTEEASETEFLREMYTLELESLNAKRSEVKNSRDDANKAMDILDAQIAVVQDKFDGEVGPIPLSTAIRGFIDSSNAERQRRHGVVVAAASKVTTNLRAPIDASRVQNRNRGAKRRVRGALNKR